MANRYGNKVKTERKWKKLSRMTMEDLGKFEKHLRENDQELSAVYRHVCSRILNYKTKYNTNGTK